MHYLGHFGFDRGSLLGHIDGCGGGGMVVAIWQYFTLICVFHIEWHGMRSVHLQHQKHAIFTKLTMCSHSVTHATEIAKRHTTVNGF